MRRSRAIALSILGAGGVAACDIPPPPAPPPPIAQCDQARPDRGCGREASRRAWGTTMTPSTAALAAQQNALAAQLAAQRAATISRGGVGATGRAFSGASAGG